MASEKAISWRQFAAIVTYMSLSDMRARYRRTVLGPIWLSLSTAIGGAGLGFVWSELTHADPREFVPMLTAGLVLWQCISGVLTEGTSVFARHAGVIRNLPLPLMLYPSQLIGRHAVNLAHTLPVFFVAALATGLKLHWTALWIIPGLIVFFANLLWMGTLLGLLGSRYRDLEHTVVSFMPLLMFISPVFYKPQSLQVTQKLVWLNPVTHLIALIRMPLMGEAVPASVLWANLGLLVVGSLATRTLYRLKRSRIPFWI